MATKTGWGMLNYTRSKDVADRQHRNYVACLRAGYAQRTFQDAVDRENSILKEGSERTQATAEAIRARTKFLDRFNAIPSRDSAMA